MYDIETLRQYDEYTLQHCINVSIYATTVGIGFWDTQSEAEIALTFSR